MAYSPSYSSSFDHTLSSNILNAIEILRARWQGTLTTHWNVVKLSPSHYALLWQQLESKEKRLAEYVRDYMRTDYDPTTFQFIVPMPLPVHEQLLSSIRSDINEQLFSIENHGNNPAAGLVKTFYDGGSTTIFFDDGGHRSPDMQLIHNNRKYPSLIVEFADLQSAKSSSLPRLADQYIVRSKGNILLVIGVEVAYRSEKSGTISTWCPEYGADDKGEYLASQQTIVSQPFLNVDGTAVSSTLRIPFRSFTPKSICSKFSPEALDVELVLSYEKLAMFLKLAAEHEEIRKTGQAVEEPLGAGIRLRKRDSTPPEILSEEDEEQICEGGFCGRKKG